MNVGIITAASEKYANSLYTLLGSLKGNWPDHPPVVVYDLGLEESTLSYLSKCGVTVKDIPAFCKHWKAHYTWKVWCMNNAEFDVIIWMDAGMCILEPLDEIINIIKKRSYFLVPNYQFLDYEVSAAACEACGVPYSFRIGKGTIAGTFIGFLKNGLFGKIIAEVMEIALVEKNIMAYAPKHKHDQSIISTLTYKYFPNPELEDGLIYLGWKSPRMVSGQKVWLQRRQVLKEDIRIYKRNLESDVARRYIPKDPHKDINVVRRVFRISKFRLKVMASKMLKKQRTDGIR
ncbi:MAG TPA: hypothetical protein VHN59_15745 [Chitinophagaceae bacterium]|nr:hypothetical protein [Chitinophagaceae bacterium]